MLLRLPEPATLGRLVGEPGETLAATLRRTLLELIRFGGFAEGARLYPQELAQRFGVSLTPVREALMQLATEGFIEATPRRGFRVRPPSAGQVRELWQARLAFETTAAELAVARLEVGEIGAADLLPLVEIQARRDARGAAMAPREHIELNAAFHHRQVELGGNRLLTGLYRGIQMQLLGAWVQRGLETWRRRLDSDAAEHHAIIDALRARDAAACTAAIRRHIGRSLDGALDDLARGRPAAAAANQGGKP